MAKQTGLHLIKGKVGEYSYYRSAGVSAPLMRRINQGMSARVKTGDEYANTRLNNAEFKNAQGLATFLFNAVPNRKASMMRRFAIAEMTKKGLEYIRNGSGNWGARIPSVGMDGIAFDLLENRAKSGPYQGEFGRLAVSTNDDRISINLTYDEVVKTDLKSKGIDGFNVLVAKGALAELVDTDGFVRQHFGVSSISVEDIQTDNQGVEQTISSFIPGPQSMGLSPSGFATVAQTPNNGMYAIVTFIPYRQVASQRHTLYEYAKFACLALGAIPE